MNRNLINQLGTFLFSCTISYVFWVTYRKPNKCKLTRLVNRYAEVTTFRPVFDARGTLLTISIVCAAVALMSIAFAASEIWKLIYGS